MGLELSLAGALPALLAMWYFDRLDAKRPEPRAALRRVALAGALSVFPCIVVELLALGAAPAAPGLAAAAFNGFLVAAAVEELAKVLCVRWFVWHRAEFDERLDGIIYGARAGLGFALVENVFYLMTTSNIGGFATMFALRAVLAVPGHATWGGLMGYYAARRRFDRTGPGLLGGYLLAVALHGAYDAAIFAVPVVQAREQDWLVAPLLAVPLAIIFFGAYALRQLARAAEAADDLAASRAATT